MRSQKCEHVHLPRCCWVHSARLAVVVCTVSSSQPIHFRMGLLGESSLRVFRAAHTKWLFFQVKDLNAINMADREVMFIEFMIPTCCPQLLLCVSIL